MAIQPYAILYDETTNETRDVKVGGAKGRTEAFIDSSGVGTATIFVRNTPTGSWKQELVLTNDDSAAIIIAPEYRVVGTGVAGQFVVAIGMPQVGL